MEESLTNIIAWSLTHKRRVLWLLVLIILVIGIVNFFVHNSFLFVAIDAPSGTSNMTVELSTEATGIGSSGSGGLRIVPRDTKSIVVSSGAYIKTQSMIDLPWYGFAFKKVTLQKDQDAEKVAYRSVLGMSCATYLPQADRLAYYDCQQASALLNYQPVGGAAWSAQTIAQFNGFSVNPGQPFMGGVLGISLVTSGDDPNPGGPILQITSSGKQQRYNAPPGLSAPLDINRAQLFTDTNNPTDNHFAIAMWDGSVFIGTLNGGSVTYDKIPTPGNYDSSYNQTLCALNSQTVSCYQGPTAYGDAPGNFDYSKVTQSHVVSYALASGAQQDTKITGNLFALTNLYMTSGGDLFAKNYYQLYHFAKSGDKIQPVSIAQSIDAAGAGDSLYYIQAGGVFVVDDANQGTTHQVFYSPNTLPKAVYPVAGKIFVIGPRKGNDPTTYAYALNQDPDMTPGKRLIDLVPFVDAVSNNIYTSDLIGDKLYVTLQLARDLTSQEINVQVPQEKEKILNYLLSNNLNLPDANVIVSQ